MIMDEKWLRRCILDGHRGTVRYVGAVPPTEGIWLGVEWDEQRGKHDGTHEGTQYFKCSPGHGSFVRPQKITQGIDVVDALNERYGETGQLSTLYVSGVTAQKTKVETIGFEKILQQQSQFDRLEEVALSKMEVKGALSPGSLSKFAPNISNLDISSNLLSFIDDILSITANLKSLRELNISNNRLDVKKSRNQSGDGLKTVKVLSANWMQLDWDGVYRILLLTPNVTDVHICFNLISHIRVKDNVFDSVQLLNLEGNNIHSWDEVQQLSALPQLQRLILNNNKISTIRFQQPEGSKQTDYFGQLAAISLNSNNIHEWQSVNEINKLRSLTDLRFKNNPLVEGMTSFDARLELIARIAGVTSVNGSPVTFKERKSAEVLFLKKYSSNWTRAGGSVDNTEATQLSPDFLSDYPRYLELVKVHGPPPVENAKGKALKEHMLSLVFKCPEDCSKGEITKRIPETMTVQQLKRLIQKLLKVSSADQRLAYINPKTEIEVEMEDNIRQLSYYAISNQDTVLVRW